MPQSRRTIGRRYLYALPCLAIASTVFALSRVTVQEPEDAVSRRKIRIPLEAEEDSLFHCIPSGIGSFPADFMTQNQRVHGGVVIHFLLALYLCAMIATVCDDYFVPALEEIASKLHLSSDVAGATFMAMGASAPELFSSIIGAFITEDDIGVGTIVGSAVFNILGITGIVGLVLGKQVLDIDWYPVARDCIIYGLTVLAVMFIIADNIVTWKEALGLVCIFVSYIIIMNFNKRIEKNVKNFAHKCRRGKSREHSAKEEKNPLLGGNVFVPALLESQPKAEKVREKSVSKEQPPSESDATEVSEEDGNSLCSPPDNPWSFVWWVLMYPPKVLFCLTIPPTSSKRCPLLFPLTFLISVFWMGFLTYLAVWMVTIIGFTFSLPDSVSGLTILAAGSSVPDLIATVVVAKGGLGNMAMSNLVGSNTFDLSFCLGVPWFFRALVSDRGYLLIYSSAMTYITLTLLLTVASFVLLFFLSGWRLNRTVGVACLGLYVLFVALACMYELNVFGEINVPTCS